MLYLANPSTPLIREAMRAGRLGLIDTPLQGNARIPEVPWCADNGCFSEKWNADAWWSWLKEQPSDGCLFAVAPDVVGDWSSTLALSTPWFDRIKGLGHNVAVVLQDGLVEPEHVPWAEIDVVFAGGSTGYKLSSDVQRIVSEAKQRGKWAHMGRVNTLRRLRLAARDGYDSVDGTYLTFGPDVLLPKLLRYLDIVGRQDALDGIR